MAQRIDWGRIIMDLGSRGYTLERIANSIGLAASSVHQVKSGTEPRYTEGSALLNLWREVMADLPMQVDDRYGKSRK